MENNMNFSFSDCIAGYVTNFNWDTKVVQVKTSDNRLFDILLTDATYAEMTRNLGEAFKPTPMDMKDMMQPGRYLFAYGIFYLEEKANFEAKHIVFCGDGEDEFYFEKQDWWINQIVQLGNFYLKAQFQGGPIDYKNYRTMLTLDGVRTPDHRQETDTISRLVYGFASAFMLTGDDRYLEAAEAGTNYLRDNFRMMDESDDIAYWVHALEVKGGKQKKILASVFGDDYDAIPAYEQIYALAGPTQTYRITGDPKILRDIEMTINLFDKYFLDKEKGGYYSHIDSVTFDPKSKELGRNRARKNWNSVGDHAPAFLINAVCATHRKDFLKMLERTADDITNHFPDYENSPFVQEKFHDDWSADKTWGWQQNNAVVGHNLKIAWNLMRINSMLPKKEYVEFAEKIAELMPIHGRDKQRGGWYDVVERVRKEGQDFHRVVWHDRKAWWQQEQGILAYLILNGILKKDEYLKLARESTAFYNAWFLDHDSGAVYFNVLANGLPYLLGTERLKGSHSMSGYHSFELAYLSAVYTNLLITNEHLDLYFKPFPESFKDGILHVEPDILPKGSIKIEAVWVDGEPYTNFNAEALTVTLPKGKQVKIKVRVVSTVEKDHFSMNVKKEADQAVLVCEGNLSVRFTEQFRHTLNDVVGQGAQKIVFDFGSLKTISDEAVRAISFLRSKIDINGKITIQKPNKKVLAELKEDGIDQQIEIVK